MALFGPSRLSGPAAASSSGTRKQQVVQARQAQSPSPSVQSVSPKWHYYPLLFRYGVMHCCYYVLTRVPLNGHSHLPSPPLSLHSQLCLQPVLQYRRSASLSTSDRRADAHTNCPLFSVYPVSVVFRSRLIKCVLAYLGC